MADIRCSNCGQNNPDFLDVCQFCQTPLTADAKIQIGEGPTKKNTGELEPFMPQWLKDVRQQGKASAEENSVQPVTQPKVQKNEAPDLLAGLASQGGDDEDDVPDWLANINPVIKPKPSTPSSTEPTNDFFAQFNKSEPSPVAAKPKVDELKQEEKTSRKGNVAPAPVEKDELSGWLQGASGTPSDAFAFQPGASADDSDWMSKFASSEPAAGEPPQRDEKEDLSWLHTLEASSRQSEDSSASRQEAGWDFGASSISSQTSGSQEDLSWLSNLGGTSEPVQPSTPSASSQEDLSWLSNLGGTSEPAQPSTPSASSQEDLGWLSNLGGTSEPAQPSTPSASSQEDLGWLSNLGGASEPASQPSASGDLDWLSNLGGASEPVQPSTPSASSQEDLGWLSNFGGTSEPAQPSTPSASSQEDLSWLSNLGGTSEPAQPSTPSASSQEDLGWLSNFGGTSEPAQPSTPSASSQEDLGWLSNLGGTSEPAQPPASGDLDWLSNLGRASEPAPQPSSSGDSDWLAGLGEISPPSTPPSAKPFGTTDELSLPPNFDETKGIPQASPFMPRRTAPLNEDALNDNMPDWLKSATEAAPSLPFGVGVLDDLRGTSSRTRDRVTPPSSDPSAPAQGRSVPVEPDVFPAPAESRSLSNQDVDSLFSMDMPDWLSQPQPGASDADSRPGGLSARDESLAPVELPSWVQAMRPVESALSETGASVAQDQPAEKEGPLAGLVGVIPFAPIGSSRRPKAFSLKLQATEEQQAEAALFDRILAGETAARAVSSAVTITSQRTLRIAISVAFWVVIGAILFLRSQFMPVSAILPTDVQAVSNTVASIPDGAPVLVVIDYEPSLAGEMEAVSGPLLDQLVLAKAPRLSFLSTSPNSSALADRLLASANISKPIEDGGLGYLAGQKYFNLGYLPGGSAGILDFMSQPDSFIRMDEFKISGFSGYAAVVVLTDNAESGRAWVEQLHTAKQANPSLANQSLILVTSAQAGPLLQPYVSSKQVAGMINGLADAARFEFVNNSRPGMARSYWDAFGIGILMAVVAIFAGSVWNLVAGIRARRANSEEG
jgi:hypothetical protein